MASIEQKSEFLNSVLLPLGLNEKIADLEIVGFLASEGWKYANGLMLGGLKLEVQHPQLKSLHVEGSLKTLPAGF